MSFFNSCSRLFAASVLSFGLAACGGGGGGNDAGGVNPDPVIEDPSQPPSLVSTSPFNNQGDVSPVANIQFVFNKNIDPSSLDQVDAVLDSSAGPLAIRAITASGNRVTLTPENPMPRGETVQARLLTTIADLDGNAPLAESIVDFDIEQVDLLQATPHEFLVGDVRRGALTLDGNGDGMSFFRAGNDQLFYRLIEDGVPTGTNTRLYTGAVSQVLPRNLDIASNGDTQVSFSSHDGNRYLLRLARWDKVTQTWGTILNLTPSPLSQVREYVSEVDNNGGMIVWTEESVNDTNRQTVRVAFPEANGFVEEPTGLRPADQRRTGLMFKRAGLESVIAWVETDNFGGNRVAFTSRNQVTGFRPVQTPTAQGRSAMLHDVAISTNGYRYALYSVRDQNDADLMTLSMSVAAPGETFGLPVAVYTGTANLLEAKLAVNDIGVAGVIYAASQGQTGTWVRRYIPATGFEAAVEITGTATYPRGIETRSIALDLDAAGNMVALVAHKVDARHDQVITAALLPRVGQPQVGIELDRAVERPTTPTVRILRHPNTSTQLVWTHNAGSANYDIRTRRMAPNGVAGPIGYLATDVDAVVAEVAGAFGPAGNGLLVWSSLQPGDTQVRQYLFNQ